MHVIMCMCEFMCVNEHVCCEYICVNVCACACAMCMCVPWYVARMSEFMCM